VGIKKNIVVTLANSNYLDQAKQLFSSVYYNAGWQGDYMLLAYQIPDCDLKWFMDRGILIRNCEPLSNEIVGEGFPSVVLSKFYLFTEEFKKWDKIIFLDSDIIVTGSLNKLTNVKSFAAVKDSFFFNLDHQIANNKGKIEIGKNFKLNSKSFNTGVMVFSSKIILENTFNEIVELYGNVRDFSRFGEQLTINLYFYKKWEKLPFVYNVFIACMKYRFPKIIKTSAIHFYSRIGFPAVWEETNLYYKLWKTNLDKADDIDLSIIHEVDELNRFEEKYYSIVIWLIAYIIDRNYILTSSYLHFFKNARMYIEKRLGDCGVFLRKRKLFAVFFEKRK
jgi:lipopolysaccharide biosynthesis glycosyltransferase